MIFRRGKEGVILTVVLLSFYVSPAQKVKYKQIYGHIEQSDYEIADSLLQIYFKDKKNKDNPNANLQYGRILKEKAPGFHPFTEKDSILYYIEQSKFYYAQAKELVNDRELRRNEEYYKEFEQRDMRTGKVDIKVFDVQFSIEDDLQWLKNLESSVVKFNQKAEALSLTYDSIIVKYQNLIGDHSDSTELFMRAGLKTIAATDQLTRDFEMFKNDLDQFSEEMLQLQALNYAVTVQYNEVTDMFAADLNTNLPDFKKNEIVLWDFGLAGNTIKTTITESILPLKNQLIEYDRRLGNTLNGLMAGDRLDGSREDIFDSFDRSLLLTFDKDPLPLSLFDIKESEISYFDDVQKQEETTSIPNTLDIISEEMDLIDQINHDLEEIEHFNLDDEYRNYSQFIETAYGGFTGLNQFLKEKMEMYALIKESRQALWDSLSERNTYMLAGGTAVPIDPEIYARYPVYENIVNEEFVTAGWLMAGSEKMFYLSEVTPERVADTLFTVKPDSIIASSVMGISSQNPSNGDIWMILANKVPHKMVDPAYVTAIDSVSVAMSTGDSTAVQTEAERNTSFVETIEVIRIQVLRITFNGLLKSNALNIHGTIDALEFSPDGGAILDIVRLDSGEKEMIELQGDLQIRP